MISSLPAPTATGRAHWLLTRLPGWAKILTVGASLWALSVGVLIATGDEYVVAAVALGAFVVPLALAAGLTDRARRRAIAPQMMLRLAACGGLLGFLASALLERPILSEPVPVFDGWVGVIEETSKLALLALLTRRLVDTNPRAGFLLGGMVGAGFSAFESAGYAVSAAINTGGSGHAVIYMVLARATAAPFTHVLWTAVAGAALFASRRDRRFRLAPVLVLTLVAVAVLHAGWDMMPSIASGLHSWLAGAHSRSAFSTTVLLDTGEAMLSAPPLLVAYRLLRPARAPGSHAALERSGGTRPALAAHTDRSAA